MKTVTRNISLTSDLLDWAERKLDSGYNNLSEVVREALRFKRYAEEADYLNPPRLKPGTLAQIYAKESKADRDRERRLARRSHRKPEAE